MRIIFLVILVFLLVGCSSPNVALMQTAMAPTGVANAVKTVIAAGTPMPTWTNTPKPTMTPTPTPTRTATPTLTVTPFSGFAVFSDKTGAFLYNAEKSPNCEPPIGCPGLKVYPVRNGIVDDRAIAGTPWWTPTAWAIFFACVVIVLVLSGWLGYAWMKETKQVNHNKLSVTSITVEDPNPEMLQSSRLPKFLSLVAQTDENLYREVTPYVRENFNTAGGVLLFLAYLKQERPDLAVRLGKRLMERK